MRRFKRSVRQFFNNLGRVLSWLPIIWNDREYDYCFLMNIIKYKLMSMELFWLSDKTITCGAAITAKQIRVARKLAERLSKDDKSIEIQRRDLKWLCNVLQKYYFHWWD